MKKENLKKKLIIWMLPVFKTGGEPEKTDNEMGKERQDGNFSGLEGLTEHTCMLLNLGYTTSLSHDPAAYLSCA